MLQVFNGFDALGQLHLQAGQRFLGQGRASLGGVTLPGQGVGQIELGQGQQGLRLRAPLGGNDFLPLAALDFVELFFQRLGRALVAIGQVFVDLGHLLCRGLAGQPLADARRALARGGRRKGAARQAVQRMRLGALGRAGFGSGYGGGGGFGFGRFGHGETEHKGDGNQFNEK